MFRKLMVAAGALAIFAAVLLAQEGSKTKQKQPAAPATERGTPRDAGDSVREAINKFVEAYTAAFNKNDASAVAAHWAESGVYVDRETGERSEGREHLLADFQKLFEDHAGAQLTVELTGTRLIKPDVAAVEGTATAVLPGEGPVLTDFSAVLAKHGDQWLIESVNESPPAAPLSAGDALKELEWMIGHWVDESEEVKVDTTVRWGADGTFLVRTFLVQTPEGETLQGTQVIGWDPRAAQIRSWKFFSDGSFGEEFWSRTGDDWVVKGTHTLADGRLASGTQVIKRVDENTQLVRLIGRDVDGVLIASSPEVKVVRLASGEEPMRDVPPAREVAPPDAKDAPARTRSKGDTP